MHRVVYRITIPSRVICKLGTLAHNRSFTVREFWEYTRSSPGTVATLVRRGVLQRISRGVYYPTSKGWELIERACAGVR